MPLLSNVSINRKLTMIILSVSGLVLLLTGMAFIVYDRIDYRHESVSMLTSLAQVTGQNCTAAITFDSRNDAEELLAAMRELPFVNQAIVYRDDGSPLASYHRDVPDTTVTRLSSDRYGYTFGADHIDLYHPIKLDNEVIGTMYIQSNLDASDARLRRYASILAVFVLVAFGIAFGMAARLRRVISDPILHLAQTVREVTERKDYGIRAQSHGSDETGFLISSFNDMLEQIQIREADIQDAQAVLTERGRKLERELVERRQAEQALRESEEKYRRIFESFLDVYYESSVEGILLTISPSSEDVIGYRPEDVVGQPVADLYADYSDRQGFLDEISKHGQVNDYVVVIKHKDGREVPVSLRSRVIRDNDGQPVRIQGAFRDITERRDAEEKHRRLQAKLEHAQRMESLGVLAGGVAHDLNNMLGPLVGYAELILLGLADDSPIRRKVEIMKTSAQDAADVIQDLLTLARRGRYELSPTCLNDVVQSYLESPGYGSRAEANPKVEIVTHLEDPLPNILGSAPHLAKVVMNLIVNAFDAIAESGTITVVTETTTRGQLPSGAEEDTDYVALRVRDTGMGIDAASLGKIFEPYYSKKEMGSSGSGLGLSVVHGIMTDHKGLYDVSSTVGGGTEFALFFPVTGEFARMKHEEQVKTIEASAKKGFPKWGYAVIAVVILAILAGAGGLIVHLRNKAQAELDEERRQAEAALAIEREKAKKRDDQINTLLGQLQSMKDESDMTAEELNAKKEMLAELELLQAEKSGKKKKKKKKKGKGSGPKGCDPLTDPTCGI